MLSNNIRVHPAVALLEQEFLWEKFITADPKPDDKQKQMVRELIAKVSDRLDLVRDTFPTYTLHNYRHSLNVVNLMGHLLGDSKITALEGAILILSAFLHQ